MRSARSDPEATGDPPAPEACHRSGWTMKQTARDRKARSFHGHKPHVINM
jgi:hypothetical protein